jgi:hypothetical protein
MRKVRGFSEATLVAFLVWGAGCTGGKGSVAEPSSPGAASSAPSSESSAAPADSDWVDASVARIRVDTGDAGGLRGCTGEITAETKAFFAKVYASAKSCAASVDGGRSITFHSTLEEGGGLSEFSVLEDKLGSEAVTQCFQQQAFSTEYPKVDPKTPCVQLVHPITFP